MKKLIFYSIIIFFFLASCTSDAEEAIEPQAAASPIPELSPETVTVYLDGNGPAESRAMNRPFAEMSCDYFEVVFVGKNSSGTVTTVKGQWRSGEKAVVSGVYRTDTGINYGSVSPAASLDNDTGSAILFAGKSDKTIMAIGKLSTATSTIRTNTASVTFELNAIKTGVRGNNPPTGSSFLTAAKSADPGNITEVSAANTEAMEELLMGRYFTAFKLKEKIAATKATYTFALHSGAFNVYTPGLIVAAPGTIEKKHPSYTLTEDGGNINFGAIIILDEMTSVTMDNNQSPNVAFAPVVEFTFNTNVGVGTTPGSIFALVFEIPIYALGVADCLWYMKPGYGVLHYELDDGSDGVGGAVLIRTGDPYIPPPNSNFKIKIITRPNKWRYRWAAAPNETSGRTPFSGTQEFDRVFNINGIQVQLQRTNGNPYEDHPLVTDGSGVILPGPGVYINPNSRYLRFYIGGAEVQIGTDLKPEFYGIIEVVVRFTDPYTGIHQEDKFLILCSGRSSTSTDTFLDNFDYARLDDLTSRQYTANTDNDFMGFMQDGPGVNRIRIVRLNEHINIAGSNMNLNPPNSQLIIVVANTANLRLGRASGNQIKIQGDRSGLAAFYFGRWPFAGLPYSPGRNGTGAIAPIPSTSLENTQHFSINAAGPISTTNATLFNHDVNTKMIVDSAATSAVGGGGGIYNVDLDPEGVTVYYPEQLH